MIPSKPLLRSPLRALDDEEGTAIPDNLPTVIDAHVHFFPEPLWRAVRGWFDAHAWPVRYRLANDEIVDFLLRRGVQHIIGLHYAHKPGIAVALNDTMAELCAKYRQVTGMATVFPGEPNDEEILVQGFEMGLGGVKLHLHVQGVDVLDEGMHTVYRTCCDHDRPLVVHASREPKSEAYPRDVYQLCSAEKVGRVLGQYPSLKLCVPHLGVDEYDAYQRLLERFDNLWLDTTMVVAGYFPLPIGWKLIEEHPDRVMYGTDFPNIPYAWDRELKVLCEHGLPKEHLARILGENARELFSIP
ncbi:MAG: amidohydrolase [Proteobacteria bacterium]|jgi:uncharacterized protein|nr:amidohydrolase [Pseudomonadota bacterium]